MSKRLADDFIRHVGYLCDKWEQYLPVYDAELNRFRCAGKPVHLLEIGVQNGGSLQLWAHFLPAGSQITGIDIDAACTSLALPENVTILIADAGDPAQLARILGGQTFDIIVDDGSHRSADIIAAFEALFDRLNCGGIYVAEDLHCSYLPAFGGGFRRPGAAVEWFKDIVDAINFDHIPNSAATTPNETRRLERLNRSIARLSFYDSMAVIEKLTQEKSRPYRRIMSGHDAPVLDPAGPIFSMAPRQIEAIRISPSVSDALSPAWAELLATAKDDLVAEREELSRVRAQADGQMAELALIRDRLQEAENQCAGLRSQREGDLVQRIADLERTSAMAAQELAFAQRDLATADIRITAMAADLQQAVVQRDLLLASTSWRVTWPMRVVGRAVQHPGFALRKLRNVWSRPGMAELPPPAAVIGAAEAGPPDAVEAIRGRFQLLQPPRIFRIPASLHRVTMVTDSISEGSLFGGVGTAIVLAAAIARHIGATLRVVTRLEPPNVANFATVMATHRRPSLHDVDFAFAPLDGSNELDISDTELFLTTSWWTTDSVRKVITSDRIVYLLQEDERMFYANSDDRLKCQEVLADDDLHFVVNSRMLFDHLTEGPEALPNVQAAGVWFEPAFPALMPGESKPYQRSTRHNFFFYARPGNPRNLYWHGLEAIVDCIQEGILDPEHWDFHFAGRDLSDLVLPRGARPILHQNLPWPRYIDLVKTIDVGLSLMATPHPSYPPLDLAAAGAVVVTNRYGRKTSLARYSNDIICVDPTVPALKQGIVEAVARSADPDRPPHTDNILRDWDVALKTVLERLPVTPHPQ